MDNKYFGTITQPNFLEWDIDTQNKYLTDIGLFTVMLAGDNIPIPKSTVPGKFNFLAQYDYNNKSYLCNTQLQKNIYNFLLDRYFTYLKAIPVNFFIKFEDSIFGLENNEIKKAGLNEFNAIYNTLKIKSFSKKGRIELLHLEREHISSNISKEREIVIAFLTGDEVFFDVELYLSNLYLQTIISFEGKLEILLELNRKYNFQTDIYFDENVVLFEKYQNIISLSITFEVFKFINKCLDITKIPSQSYVVSLYFFLFDNQLINENRTIFQDFINSQFDLKIKRIKNDFPENKKHLQRMEKFKVLWADFALTDGE
ncbi:hypothetical protein [uncultured Maribacter sp.]|uniref:hypothetical protein n=1 Tax=uncultured Maribacter sp. TaxID=431308 RepID=UPI0030D84869|tara:strand:- start:2707 stop:3648 length:942 start_codon:yes stop_codon:yes gene_type:complete